MAHLCSVCTSPKADVVNAALLAHRQGYVAIAGCYGLKTSSLQRHAGRHLRAAIREAAEETHMASVTSLQRQMRTLQARPTRLLDTAEAAGDLPLALAAKGAERTFADNVADGEKGEAGQLHQPSCQDHPIGQEEPKGAGKEPYQI